MEEVRRHILRAQLRNSCRKKRQKCLKYLASSLLLSVNNSHGPFHLYFVEKNRVGLKYKETLNFLCEGVGVQRVHSVQRKEFTWVKFSDFFSFLFFFFFFVGNFTSGIGGRKLFLSCGFYICVSCY